MHQEEFSKLASSIARQWRWRRWLPNGRAKNLWRVLHTLEPEHKTERLIVNWLASNLDHLWMATQRLDALGHVLRTLAFEDTCPFCEAVRQYTRIIVGPLDVGELRRLIFHLQLQSENGNMGDMDFDEVIDNIRTLSCSLACQITWRAIWLFQGRPIHGSFDCRRSLVSSWTIVRLWRHSRQQPLRSRPMVFEKGAQLSQQSYKLKCDPAPPPPPLSAKPFVQKKDRYMFGIMETIKMDFSNNLIMQWYIWNS